MSDNYISIGEAVEITGKSKFTIKQWCQKGIIECRKSGTGTMAPWIIYKPSLLNKVGM